MKKAKVTSQSDPEAVGRLARVIGEVIPGVVRAAGDGSEAVFLVPAGDGPDFERYARLAGCSVEWVE